MLPYQQTTDVIDQKIIDTINALGQLGIGALVLVVCLFGLFTLIIYLRLRSRSDEADAKREAESSKILMEFAQMVRQADINREKALDNRDSETGKAIITAATITATAMDASTKAIENNTAVQVRQEEHREQVRLVMREMVDETHALRKDVKEWPSAVISAMGVLEKSVDELKGDIADLQRKVSEALMKCSERDDTALLTMLQDILAGINTLTTNQRELTALVEKLRVMYDAAFPPNESQAA